MEISKQASSFFAGVMVGIVGNLFASCLVEALDAMFENKPFNFFFIWAVFLIITSVGFFQLAKFVMKIFKVPKKALYFLDIMTITFVVIVIIWIIGVPK